MRIVWSTPGRTNIEHPVWPETWPIPRVGDEIGWNDGETMRVHVVAWYPAGEFDTTEPFVYVVLR